MTIKEFKAQFVVGARLLCTEHWIAKNANVHRTITKAQGNGYFYTQDGFFKPDGTTLERYWSPFPKKTELTFHEDGRFTICPEGGNARVMFWTLRFIRSEDQ